ncbi:MAG: hypothetical protein JNM94_15005 [Phycisphaerae bacterium]|nr:hypothetical protein [Phycisphaerae bacterium]
MSSRPSASPRAHARPSDSPEINPNPTPGGFEAEATRIASELRSALGAVMRSVRADVTRPQDMSRRYGLNKNLTWKISKILGDDSLETIARHLPGRPGFVILLRTLKGHGAPDDLCARLQASLDTFDLFVRDHAGDRETFASMTAALAGGEAQREELARKAAFQGNSAIFGVQARLQCALHAVFPGSAPDRASVAVVCGLVDLRRLRRGVSWPVAFLRSGEDGGSELALRSTPLDPRVKRGEPAIMHDFSTIDASDVRLAKNDGALRRWELSEGPLGKDGSVTCLVGSVSRDLVSLRRTEKETVGEHIVSLTTPAEEFVLDVLVHRSLPLACEPSSAAPEAFLVSQLPAVPVYPHEARSGAFLPLSEAPVPIGRVEDLALPAFAEYQRVVETVCAAGNATFADMRAYRLRFRYPPMPALAIVRYPLPE